MKKKGENATGTNCSGKTQVFSRVVGFYSPVQDWHIGKKEEFRLRKTFSISEAMKKISEEDQVKLWEI